MTTHLICDLQFGSTGKGLYAGHIARRHRPSAIVTAWMPNAGHTFVDSDGTKYVHSMLANGVVSESVEEVFIGPGSVLNIEGLHSECAVAHDKLVTSGLGTARTIKIMVHENAAIRRARHIEKEGGLVKIGSTMKGCAAAVIEKIERNPGVDSLHARFNEEEISAKIGMFEISVVSHYDYLKRLSCHKHVLIEGAQGYSLGINSGIWPYVTSRECTPQQILSDCCIPMDMAREVVIHGTMRTYPIRVANRYNDDGGMIGTSGPGYVDQKELSWSQLHIEPELTTVTKLPRRVFEFSMQQFAESYMHTRPRHLFLNFVNYMSHDGLKELLQNKIVPVVAGCGGSDSFLLPITFGAGPKVDDIHEAAVQVKDGQIISLMEYF